MPQWVPMALRNLLKRRFELNRSSAPETAWEPEDRAPWPRLAMILRPKALYLAWVRKHFPEMPMTLAALRSDAIVYLVPTVEFDPADAHAFVAAHYGRFFAQELEQWTTDRTCWPAPRSLEVFRQWFEVEVIDRVIDVG